jgi:hypothetical protein
MSATTGNYAKLPLCLEYNIQPHWLAIASSLCGARWKTIEETQPNFESVGTTKPIMFDL